MYAEPAALYYFVSAKPVCDPFPFKLRPVLFYFVL